MRIHAPVNHSGNSIPDGWNGDVQFTPPSTHSCGQCKSQFGISAIPCKNDPAVIAAARATQEVPHD